MNISEWLDAQEAGGIDVASLSLPEDLSFDEEPDEILFFKEINPCGILCTRSHPYSKVERFGRWYYSHGQDKEAGIHSSKGYWHLFTKDPELAIRTARQHLT